MDTIDSINIGQGTEESEGNVKNTTEDVDANKWLEGFKQILDFDGKPKVTMPVERDADRYNMSHPKRGKAVIFNHMNFTNGQSTRNGTDKDEENLQTCLKGLKFDVVVHRDLKRLDIFKILETLSQEDHSQHDCLVIIVLSHGDKDKIFSSDADYRPEDLWDPFAANRCPTLAGKPKLFFIQACRGDQLDGGTTLSRTQTDSRAVAPDKTYIIPNRADFLIVYSTVEGYYSWRNTRDGSWFVASLTKVLNTYKGTKDLLSLMTIVTREVALNFESCVPTSSKFDQKKQVPMISSTLMRDIYF